LVLLSTLNPDGHEYFTDTFSYALIALVFFISSFGIVYYIRYREKGKINRRLENEIKINKEKEDALKLSEAKFKEINATKDKFFSILSHDLKSPFAAIMGMAEFLEKEYSQISEDDRIVLVKELGNATRNTYDLLQELLIWSQSQRGLLEFNPIPTNLFNLCNDSIELVHAAAAKKSIAINCLIDENIIVNTDNNMLSTVIRNLLTNAIKFTNKGGKVEITNSPASNNNNPAIRMVKIGISDNGVGISKENIGRLLKIDDKFKSYGTEKESGTGLGLIICQEFVEKHGGNISIESEPGKGSTFSFTLPLT